MIYCLDVQKSVLLAQKCRSQRTSWFDGQKYALEGTPSQPTFVRVQHTIAWFNQAIQYEMSNSVYLGG